MNTIRVDVINPKSLRLLEQLEELQLISIHKEGKVQDKKSDFMDVVRKIRSKSLHAPSLDEITAEVEQQRAEMYAFSWGVKNPG